MKLLEVPVFNDDGSIHSKIELAPNEVQILLQFAVNFLTSAGLSVNMIIKKAKEKPTDEEIEDEIMKTQLDLFNPGKTND
jgi:hypothetical protein